MATQTVAYSKKSPTTGSWTIAKSQVQDEIYGVSGKSTRQRCLGFADETGKLFLGSELLTRMKTPVWGPNKDQYFADLLPVFPAKVPEVIPSSHWESFVFDPDNPETYPQSECPPGAQYFPELGTVKGWECQHKRYPNLHYQNVHWMGEESINVWRVMEVSTYRRQKESTDNPFIPNPEYPIIEEQRRIAGEQYSAIVRSTLIPVASYQFQGLPLNGGYENGVYKWRFNPTEPWIDPIPGHKLAVVVTSGVGAPWTFLPAPMRNPEMHYQRTSAGNSWIDIYEQQYVIKTQSIYWDLSKDAKMVMLSNRPTT